MHLFSGDGIEGILEEEPNPPFHDDGVPILPRPLPAITTIPHERENHVGTERSATKDRVIQVESISTPMPDDNSRKKGETPPFLRKENDEGDRESNRFHNEWPLLDLL
jgi:hypothetical protein